MKQVKITVKAYHVQVLGFQLQDALRWLQRGIECILVRFGVCYPLFYPNHLTRSQQTVREQPFLLFNEKKKSCYAYLLKKILYFSCEICIHTFFFFFLNTCTVTQAFFFFLK